MLEKEAEDVVDVSEPKKKIAKKAVQQQQDEDLDPIMEAFAESPKKSNT